MLEWTLYLFLSGKKKSLQFKLAALPAMARKPSIPVRVYVFFELTSSLYKTDKMKRTRLISGIILLFAMSCSKPATMINDAQKSNAEFTNTRWKLVKLPGTPLPQMKDVFIRFDPEKANASGNAGCNRFTGQYNVSGNRLKLGPVAATKMMCTPEVMPVEIAFLQALDECDNFSIAGDNLLLKKGENILAEFEALYLK